MMNLLNKLLVLLFVLVLSINQGRAAIVYTDVNPDSTMTLIPGSIIFGIPLDGAGSGVRIDFDNDGTIDCMFRWDLMVNGPGGWFIHAVPSDMGAANQNDILLDGTTTNPFGARYAKVLNQNDAIGPGGNWGNGFPEPLLGDNTDPNFAQKGDKYFGVRFDSGSNTYFGWVLVNLDTTIATHPVLKIKSYAYEDVSNTSILAGDNGSGTSVVLITSISAQGQGGVSSISIKGGTLQMEAVTLPLNVTDSTVTWSLVNGTGIASIVDSTGFLTSLSNGTVTVVASANDNSGITDSVQIMISNQNIGLVEFGSSKINVYPNPSNHFIEVESNGLDVIDGIIYSKNGQLMMRHSFLKTTNFIDVSSLRNGVYFLVLEAERGKVVGIKKWIKY